MRIVEDSQRCWRAFHLHRFHDYVVSRHLPCRVHTWFLRHRIPSSQTQSFLGTGGTSPSLCNSVSHCRLQYNSCNSIVLPLLLHWLAAAVPSNIHHNPISWHHAIIINTISDWSSSTFQRTRDKPIEGLVPLSDYSLWYSPRWDTCPSEKTVRMHVAVICWGVLCPFLNIAPCYPPFSPM